MSNLNAITKNIKDKKDFLKFMEILIANLKNNPAEWENKSLESYLEAIESWVDDMEGYYQNTNQPIPKNADWQTFADILTAAKHYE